MNRKIKAWYQASRPPFFIATFIPLGVGWLLAAKGGEWHPGRMLLVFCGSFAVHLATNLNNDYFDHVQGTDAGDAIGGSRVIQEGSISPHEILTVIMILYIAASAIALFLLFSLRIWGLLPFIIIAFFSSIFYVAPPVRYGYHGLGELFCGISMGPVMVIGTYWVIAGQVALRPLIVSIPIGFMVASILYYQNLPDMDTDRTAGKRTLAVMLGKNGAFIGFILSWAIIYGAITALVFTGILAPVSSLTLATIPVFLRLCHIIRKTENWVFLDGYGSYVRILYFINGLLIMGGVM